MRLLRATHYADVSARVAFLERQRLRTREASQHRPHIHDDSSSIARANDRHMHATRFAATSAAMWTLVKTVQYGSRKALRK
jgi:hypothetical protein